MAKEALTPIGLRMKPSRRKMLDDLCKVNERSRREIIEILIEQAHKDWKRDAKKRLNP